MVVQTSRFGEVEVDAARIIELEGGLLGFPQERRYCLLEAKAGSPFQWMQSVERPELAFLVVGPHEFFADYEVFLGDETAAEMALEKPEEAAVLALVSVQEDQAVTANLVGPVVVNTRTGRGRQIVLDTDQYTTRHRLCTLAQPRAETAA
jgi:flagellar assembly factor FliW